MGSTTASLAWSVPVRADILAAHLDAYKSLHEREIKSLRLCHRFGQGEKAAVTRLPVELVALIEDYLMQDARQEALDYNYEQAFRCWEGKCRPREHLADHELAEAYLPLLGPYKCSNCDCWIRDSAWDDCDCRPCRPGIHRLPDECVTPLDEVLLDDYNQGFESDWYGSHRELAADWQLLVRGTRGAHGIFDGHRHRMLRDFGLQLWWSHTQLHPAADEVSTRFKYNQLYRSTTAHVILPNADFTLHFERAVWDLDRLSFGDAEDTDAGQAIDVARPESIVKKDIAKFRRAFQILGLMPVVIEKPSPVLSSATPRDRKTQSDATKQNIQHTKDDKSEPWVPKLRLLLKTELD